MDFDIVVCSKLIDDTSRSLETIYTKFYLPEVLRHKAKVDDHNIPQRVKEIISSQQPYEMEVFFCIRGIGNHDQLPYLPPAIDEEHLESQDKLIKVFLHRNTETYVVLFFRMLQKLVAQ